MVSTMGEVYWRSLSLSTLNAIDCSKKKGGFTRSTNRASGLYLTGAETRKPTVEIVEAGHDGDADHEIQQGLDETEVDLARRQHHDQNEIGKLNQGRAFSQQGRGNIQLRFGESAPQRAGHEHHIPTDHHNRDPRGDQVKNRQRDKPGGE